MDWAALQPGALFESQGYRSLPLTMQQIVKKKKNYKKKLKKTTTHVSINLTLKNHMVGKEKENKQTDGVALTLPSCVAKLIPILSHGHVSLQSTVLLKWSVPLPWQIL